MKNILSLLCCAFFTLSGFAQSPAAVYVHSAADGKSWRIGNDLVEREVEFDSDHGLRTRAWRHKVTGTDFMAQASARAAQSDEFSFQYGPTRFAGAGAAFALACVQIRDIAPAGKLLALQLRARAQPLTVTAFYAVYAGHPVVRKWLSIRNDGAAPVVLTHLVFESVGLAPGAPADIAVSAFYGVEPREIFYTGRVEDPAISVKNSRSREGYIVMNEAPGYLKRSEILPGWRNGLEVMYDTDLFPFERRLDPGETFITAKSSVAFFAEGRGFADPRWVMPSYTAQVLMKKRADYQPLWIYNTWEPFQRRITEAITLDLIAAAGRMGMDVFTIDDGWQADYGSNVINTRLFKSGLDAIETAVENHGMRLGLWFPLAVVSPNTQVYREHPEWLCRDRDGKPKFTFTMAGAQAVMCMDTPYKIVAARRLNSLIARYHLKYVKLDLTTVFNAYGESPGCYAQGHDHQTWAESLDGIYEGINYVTASVYREHPDVVLDLTYELWGQKHIIDYGLLAAGDLDWLSNVTDASPLDAGPRAARTLLYLRSLAIPVETMLIGNLHADSPPIDERLATAMGAGPLFCGDLRRLTPAQQAWYGEKIRWFKTLRRAVPFNEGFFPLGSWRQPSAAAWDGYARLSRLGAGMIALFRNDSHATSVSVSLPVYPDGEFVLRSAMDGAAIGTCSGADFRRGVEFQFPVDSGVQVIEIRKLAHDDDAGVSSDPDSVRR
ncbi:MAG TPA: alpha-galactosidase [Opitutaceae bacterium]|jgi:alpha-galactosidase|nr:alpha-galactosidase [Opitutaceae bacterium]